MRGDEIAVRLVQRVPIAVIDDGKNLLAVVLSNNRRITATVGAILVDVVARVEDGIKPLIGDSAKRREISGFVMIAAADGKTKSIDGGVGRGCRLRSADLAHLTAGVEAVPVFASWLKTLHLDMHAMTKLRSRDLDAFLFNRAKSLIARDLPADFHFGGRHPPSVERIALVP